MNTKEAEYNLLLNEIANLDDALKGAVTDNERNMLAAELELKEHEIYKLGEVILDIYKTYNVELDRRIIKKG